MFSRIKDKFSNKKSSTKDHTHFDRGNSNSNPKNNPFLDVPEEAPPAYEPTQRTAPLLNVPQRGASPAPSISSITSAEDRYAFLSTFDTIFVIDDSGSMAGRSWREVRETLSTIAPICTSHDPDGIDVYFLNHRSPAVGTGVQAPGGYFQIRDANQVQHLFESVRPCGATPTGSRLHSILKPYVAHLSRRAANVDSTKPVNIIVITDGCPTDDPESIIIHHAKKLDQIEAPPHQVGIQFFQVGNELGATKALRELDDDLADQGIRDMVDAATWNSATSEKSNVLTADGILKVVLGAVVRRLDRRPNS
ncbi:von Willebrand factor A-like domain superfamily [Fusarium oxysporum f. sp. vasinfectum]|nr:von Willebrand factor A-like domain superfamily [Fusarium oxysporum f. sp. vasinfectum]